MEHVGTRAVPLPHPLPLFHTHTHTTTECKLRTSSISEVVAAYVVDCNGVYWGWRKLCWFWPLTHTAATDKGGGKGGALGTETRIRI